MQLGDEFDPISGRIGTLQAGQHLDLDLYEGICEGPPRIEDPRGGCKRWPEHLRLFNETTGELVIGRCGATNLCRYCQALYVLETTEMLTLDALEYAPELWVVLTAREHLTRRACHGHLRELRRTLKQSWPTIEWFVQVEFQRRGALHLNLLVKGVPAVDSVGLLTVASGRWCHRVDAAPAGQWCGRVNDGEGLVRYLQKTLSHGLKAEQAPPIGWRGHRTSQTRGYLARPAAQMREEARAALKVKRELHRALKAGYEGADAERVALQAIADHQADEWRIYSAQHLLAGQDTPPVPQRAARDLARAH
jgi:hypothetical protein